MPQVHSYGQFLNRAGGPFSWDSPTGDLRGRLTIVADTAQGGGQTVINVWRVTGITPGNETAIFDPYTNIMTVEASANEDSTYQQIADAIDACVTYGVNTLISSVTGGSATLWDFDEPGTGSTASLSTDAVEFLNITGNLDTDFADVTRGYTINLEAGAATSTPEITVNDPNKVITVKIQDGVTTYTEIHDGLEATTINSLANALEVEITTNGSGGATVYTLGGAGNDTDILDGGADHVPDTVTLSPLWHDGFDFQVDQFGFAARTPFGNPAGYEFVPQEGDLIADEFGMVWEILGTSYNDSTGTPIPDPLNVAGQRWSVNVRGASQYHSDVLGTPIPTGSAKCLISRPTDAGLVTFFNKSNVAWNSHDGATEYNFRNLEPTVDLSGIRGGPPCLEGQSLDTMQKIVQSIGGQYDYDSFIKGGVPVDGDTLNKLYLLIQTLREVDLNDAIDVGNVIDRDVAGGTYAATSGEVIGVDTSSGSTFPTVTIELPGHVGGPSNNDTLTIYSLNDWSTINPIIDPGVAKIRGTASAGDTVRLNFGARIHLVYSSEASAWIFKL